MCIYIYIHILSYSWRFSSIRRWILEQLYNLFSLFVKLPQLIKIVGVDCHFRFFWLLTIACLIVVIENQQENRMVK